MKIKIRKIKKSEISEIKEFMVPIWYDTYKDYLTKGHIDTLIKKNFENKNLISLINNGLIYEKIFLDNKFIGFLAYYLKEDHLYLDKLYFIKDAQNKRISTFIINYLDTKNNIIRLGVDKLNEQAVRSYKRNNFKIIKDDVVVLDDGSINDDYIMERNVQGIIDNAIEFIKDIFKDDCTGHDFNHTMRVYHMALSFLDEYPANKFILSLTALLHDVDDHKLFKESNNAKNFLDKNNIEDDIKIQILNNINEISFKGIDTKVPDSLEGKIVQDADRLDAIGAIGIARCFTYGGARKRKMYDFNELPNLNMDVNTYYNKEGNTLNHFYEKLLLLKDMMNTTKAKKIALKRHQFMEDFLKEFKEEVGDFNENSLSRLQ